jgi:formylglycine-generating enzyme required for sulfatase activity
MILIMASVTLAAEAMESSMRRGWWIVSLVPAAGCLGYLELPMSLRPVPGMVEVAGGTFEMGSNVWSDSLPTRQVNVDTFWIDELEVTVAAYAACVDEGVCTEPRSDPDMSCNSAMPGRDDHPVNCVSWFQATEYCGWADAGTKRLPTEAEWEKAARGTDAYIHPWGDQPVPRCSHAVVHEGEVYDVTSDGCGMGRTWPVGSKPLGGSPYGVLDMTGNVAEWVADWYATSYDSASTDDPRGPGVGHERVLRGGDWRSAEDLGTAHRDHAGGSVATDVMGFRCAQTPPVSESSGGACGNGEIDEGEDCDGTEWNGTTCASLGLSGTGLACVGCRLDASGCGPMPGMVEVPGGTFEMGSMASSNEQPIRQVYVDAFWIDQTEVTVAAYAACVAAGACSEPSWGTDTDCNWMVAGREAHPVNCVTWYQADGHCRWAGGGTKRLPTEAEWEKTARGTDARLYPWGNAPAPSCTHAVLSEDGEDGCGMSSTWPVGSRPLGASPYGALDMVGNVWEWVFDYYGPYDPADTVNPTGPTTWASPVERGGAWNNPVELMRTTERLSGEPGSPSPAVGFRCARTPPAPS